MIMSMGVAVMVVGGACLAWACSFPRHRVKLEQWGGGLFVGGIVLLSAGFTMI